jgi:probable HAF family extracellular repeat protein
LSGPDGGALRDLGTFNGEQILITDVNDLGQVVGYSPADAFLEKVHAFVSAPDAGAFTDLGVLFRNTSSSASAINDAGVVVGTNTTHNGPNVGFVYTLANGMQDLNTLINPDLNFHFEEAIDINERGQILATGYLNNQFHTYLLTPFNVPDEASTVILLGLSLVSLAVLARRHHPCGAPADH